MNNISTDIIRNQLQYTLPEAPVAGIGERYRGKVRDTYSLGDQLILVTTDRISAFDHVIRQTIPFKGQVLNQVATYFFERTSDIIENHVLAVPDPNVTVAIRCKPVQLEFVVRGYLVGHAWRTYKRGGRTLCGKVFADGMRENERLPKPILTPTTKAHQGHDEDISEKEAIGSGLIDKELFDQLEAVSLSLFERGTRMAEAEGLILVDTKYEFGITPDGRTVLIDEVHTPDSSRYFYSAPYEGLLRDGQPQKQLSKEFVRQWLTSNGFSGKTGQSMPDLPDEVRTSVSARYLELYGIITGRRFEPDTSRDPAARIEKAIWSFLDS